MIQEYFHEDHSNQPRHVIILSEDYPTNDFEMLQKDQKYNYIYDNIYRYKNKVFYIEGKLREEYTMQRCKMHEAVAVFILPNKNAMNKPEEDTETVLTLFYIKKYLASSKSDSEENGRKTKICIQLLQNDLINHVKLNMTSQDKLIMIGNIWYYILLYIYALFELLYMMYYALCNLSSPYIHPHTYWYYYHNPFRRNETDDVRQIVSLPGTHRHVLEPRLFVRRK
jgi:hypothetical protein